MQRYYFRAEGETIDVTDEFPAPKEASQGAGRGTQFRLCRVECIAEDCRVGCEVRQGSGCETRASAIGKTFRQSGAQAEERAVGEGDESHCGHAQGFSRAAALEEARLKKDQMGH